MSKKDNRTCIICGKSYYYCPSCGHDSHKPAWYAIFDGENCHTIYEVCTDYRDNRIDKEEANARINKCDLSDIKDFPEATQNQIKEMIKVVEDKKEQDATVRTENKPKNRMHK